MLHIIYNGECIICLHSPERMTVNHDVTGSSPVGGATKEAHSFSMSLDYLYIKFYFR